MKANSNYFYSFRLDGRGEDSQMIIFCHTLKKERKEFRYSTKKKIHPDDWDLKNRFIKRNLKHTSKREGELIKKHLNNIVDNFIKISQNYIFQGKKLTSEALKVELNAVVFNTSFNGIRFEDVFEEYLDYHKTSYGGKGVTFSTIKKYNSLRNHLVNFSTYENIILDLDDFTENFYNKFYAYLKNKKKLGPNTRHRYSGMLNAFMNWANETSITSNASHKKVKRPQEIDTNEVALTIEELKIVFEFDLSEIPRLEKVRDLFIIGCMTGLRYGNFVHIRRSNIQGNNIVVRDNKNQNKVTSVPLEKTTAELLQKYNYNLPEISNQKFNAYIKEIFKLAGLDRPTFIYTENSTKKHKEVPLYERISSHTARRSFITILLSKGISEKTVMEMTGHKTTRVFQKYYRVNDKMKQNAVASLSLK